MFLTENLPELDAKPQLTIIETAQKPSGSNSVSATSMIKTVGNDSFQPAYKTSYEGKKLDMRSYVLDEYKEVLFPKNTSKYEKAHNEHLERQKHVDEDESKEVRKKILALAQMMQYDDDVEESKVTETKLLKPSVNNPA